MYSAVGNCSLLVVQGNVQSVAIDFDPPKSHRRLFVGPRDYAVNYLRSLYYGPVVVRVGFGPQSFVGIGTGVPAIFAALMGSC